MAVTCVQVKLFYTKQVTTAPLIEGATPASFTDATGTGFTQTTAFTGRYGCRTMLAATTDFTTHAFINFGLTTKLYPGFTKYDTVANGGVRVVFVDTLGNYSGFNVNGHDVPGQSQLVSANEGITTYWAMGSQPYKPEWFISPARTPDIQSATPANMAAIVAVEFSVNNLLSGGNDIYMMHLAKTSAPVITESSTFYDAANALTVFDNTAGAGNISVTLFQRQPWYAACAAQAAYSAAIPFQIGNGVTTTTINESAFAIGFRNTWDTRASFRCVGPLIQLDGANHRPLKIIQSATDTLTLADGSFASAAWWQWQLSGAGVATCTRVAFWRFNEFLAAHGSYVDCTWNGGAGPVEITPATVLTGGTILNATTTSLKILGAPGTWAFTAGFNNPSATADIELGSGGAGTYTLAGVSVPSGYTLKVRNSSATNAVTVQIPAGMAYSSTTAGGAITVTTLQVTLTITDIQSGSDVVVLAAGTATLLASVDQTPGTSWDYTYSTIQAVDIGVLKPGFVPRYLRNYLLGTASTSLPITQQIDRNYL